MAKDKFGHGSEKRGVSAVQARNDRMHAMFERAREQGHYGLRSGPFPEVKPAAHQSGVEAATRDLASAGKGDMNAHVAAKVLAATDSHGKDYHTLSSSQTSALSDYAKQFGYRKSTSSPGSTGRAFHGYLHKQLGK